MQRYNQSNVSGLELGAIATVADRLAANTTIEGGVFK